MYAEPMAPAVKVTTPEPGESALRIFFRIADAWKLSNTEQMTLLGVSRTKLFSWKAGKLRVGLDKGTTSASR